MKRFIISSFLLLTSSAFAVTPKADTECKNLLFKGATPERAQAFAVCETPDGQYRYQQENKEEPGKINYLTFNKKDVSYLLVKDEIIQYQELTLTAEDEVYYTVMSGCDSDGWPVGRVIIGQGEDIIEIFELETDTIINNINRGLSKKGIRLQTEK